MGLPYQISISRYPASQHFHHAYLRSFNDLSTKNDETISLYCGDINQSIAIQLFIVAQEHLTNIIRRIGNNHVQLLGAYALGSGMV